MKTLAAILVETGKPLVLSEIEIPPLKPGQVLVEVHYTSICHTQILECKGYRGPDKFLPHGLGHEGSGVVQEVGTGVKKVKSGDRVMLSWMKGSGMDVPCTEYLWDGKKVNSGAITTFSRYSIISENRLTVLPSELPLSEASLFGCALPTGLGAVFNTLHPKPGESVAIFGVGGIGFSALMATALCGCVPIFAVDVKMDRLKKAEAQGATHTIDASVNDPVAQIKKICPGGVDYAVEASGNPQVMSQALESVRNQGGAAVVIGNAQFGKKVDLDPVQMNLGKKLLGTWGGDNVPDRDFPRYFKLAISKKLDMKPYVSRSYKLTEINQAIEDMANGMVFRPLIETGPQS